MNIENEFESKHGGEWELAEENATCWLMKIADEHFKENNEIYSVNYQGNVDPLTWKNGCKSSKLENCKAEIRLKNKKQKFKETEKIRSMLLHQDKDAEYASFLEVLDFDSLRNSLSIARTGNYYHLFFSHQYIDEEYGNSILKNIHSKGFRWFDDVKGQEKETEELIASYHNHKLSPIWIHGNFDDDYLTIRIFQQAEGE